MKSLFAKIAAAIVVAAPFVFWIALNVKDGCFSADGPQQLLLWGRFCGLLAAVVFLFQFASMGQKRFLDSGFSKSRLVTGHRAFGGMVVLPVFLHIGLVLGGRQAAFGDMDFTGFLKDPFGIAACAGLAALLAVWATAFRFSHKKLPFPAFRKMHKLVYAVFLCLMAHPLMGRDFAHPSFKIAWIALAALVLAELFWSKRKTA